MCLGMAVMTWIILVAFLTSHAQISRAPYHVFSDKVECENHANDMRGQHPDWDAQCVLGDLYGPNESPKQGR